MQMQLTPDREQWVSTNQAATYYSKTSQTIRNWCRDGFIIKLGGKIYRNMTGDWYVKLPSDDTK